MFVPHDGGQNVSMIRAERQQAILRELELRGTLTVADFAARTGVSEMTVRRDLMQLERAELLERVHGGAVRRPDGTSRTARIGPVATIGFIVPSATYYFSAVIAGAKAAAAEANVRLVLGITDYQPRIERQQIARLLDARVDGLIVTPADPFTIDDRTYRILADAPVPVVIMERSLAEAPTGLRLGAVRSDHAYGAMTAVQHLVETGRRRIGLVARRRGATVDPVHEGYRRAIAALVPEATPLEFEIQGADGTAEQWHSYEAIIEDCIAAEVDGLVVLPDAAAIAITDLALDRGISVPDDLSIVAYDDEIASLATVPLTAVAPPKSDVGAVAVRACVALVARRDDQRLPAPARVQLLPTLTVRESTTVVPADGSAG